MSSHQIKLRKAFENFRAAQELQEENVTNEYNRGFYNGLEYAMYLMSGRKPNYIKKAGMEIKGTREVSDWQEIMVKYCGEEWAVKQLASVDVFKMAEDFNKLKEELRREREAVDFYASGNGERDHSQVIEIKPMYESDETKTIGIDGIDNIQKNKGIRHGKKAREIQSKREIEL